MNRLVTRNANPFAPIAKIRNQQLTPVNPYEKLSDRIKPCLKEKKIVEAVKHLTKRLSGEKYNQSHFGRLELVPIKLVDINIDIQRLLENEHIANIITNFDPRILQPVNVIFIKETGRYSAWDGQQSSAVFAILYHFNLIDDDTLIQCKVVDDDLTVPGSNLVGEAVGNYGFRTINGTGRKPVDSYWTHRSRVNGARRYGSLLREDQQSLAIQEVMESNNMFPAPSVDAQGRRALPGMVTYITGVNQVAGHDTEEEKFEVTKQDLEFALSWHDRYFASEKGVDGGIILTMGRLHAASRGRLASKNEPAIQPVPISDRLGKELADMIRNKYLNPAGFHADCKDRLRAWQEKKDLKTSWSDSCLTPFLVMDYLKTGGKEPVPMVQGIKLYAGI